MTQSLRRSQFIVTYGPGAVLEGPEGPRIIPSLDRARLFENDRSPEDFEITDLRLSQALLGGSGILRLPSNAELGVPDSHHVYWTESFPRWALCTEHQILYRKRNNTGTACPRCPQHENVYKAWDQAHRQAIRFVRACSAGHLDDVNWVRTIQHAREDCNPSYLFWRGGGGALRHVEIVCPACGNRVNLGTAYARDWPCSGRFPEFGSDGSGDCDRSARIIQRGAANLRIADVQTALTIPPRSSPLHRLLEMSNIRSVLITNRPSNKQALVNAVEQLAQHGMLPRYVVDGIRDCDEHTIMTAIEDTIADVLPQSVSDLQLQEFDALSHAATNGAPPEPSSTPGAPHQFEVVRGQVRTVSGPGRQRLRITPVSRLRVVMVQTGYRRLDPLNESVERVFSDGQRRWFPGVELFGEGIFVDLAPSGEEEVSRVHSELEGDAAGAWFDAWIAPETYGHDVSAEESNRLHPVFVWWHTFSHRLINALAIDSGYSSAAIRERVFVRTDADGNAGGGVLLYTAQPGGDGTLGGLSDLCANFERVLHAALRSIDACSNDPLCEEERFVPGKYNGAACYACALTSETSCEHRNMYLDRNLFRANLP